jgi:hypothetical protein
VGDDHIRPDALYIIFDGGAKILQGDIDPTGDAVDFHVRIDKRQKIDVVYSEDLCSFADFLLTKGAEVVAGGQGRLADFTALSPGGFQDGDAKIDAISG